MKKRIVSLLLVLVLVCSFLPMPTVRVQAAGLSLQQLKDKFPQDAYWNGGNVDSYTRTPCASHSNCDLYGGCNCNSFSNAIQCYGFALKLGYDAFGTNPRNWAKAYNLNNIKPGDIINYDGNNPGHTVFVTGVVGNTVYFAECNWGGRCRIRWDRSLQKSEFNNLYNVYIAPTTLNIGGHSSHSYSITEFEAAHPHKEYKKCSCGDWQYTGNTIYVSGCSYCNDSCNCSTSYAGTYTTNNVSTVLRIRDAHSTSGNVIGEIPANAEFSVSKANGSWAHVTYNGLSGYVSQDYIKKVVASQPVVVDTRYPTPIKMYTLSNNHYGANAYFTYEDLLAAPSTDGQYVYGDTNGVGDFVTINAVYTTQNVYLNCPWGSSTKDVYSYGSQFFYDMSVTPKKQTAEKKIYTYIRAGSSTKLGYIDPGDLIYILGSQNGYTQVIYPFTADGTYRCGWCLTSDLAHTHSYGAWSNYNSSVHMHSCICGTEETASHTWNAGVVSKNATCTSSGIKTYTCTGCNATKTEYIPTLAHNYTAGNYIEPTHPHTIYNTCSCGAKVDSGNKQTVSSCTQCFPAPVVSGIVSSKNEVYVGDTVKFTLNATGATEYCIAVGDGTNVLLEKKQTNNSVNFTFTKEGVHYIWGYAYNGEVYSASEALTITVKKQKILSAISIESNPTKTVYQIGDTLDTSGLKLKLTYSDGTTESITTGFTISGFSAATAGSKKVTVSYSGKTTSFNVTVKPAPVDENATQIMVDKKTASAGQTVQIKVELKNNPGIAGLAISLKYDESVLTLKNSENGELFSGFTAAKNFAWDESDDVLEDGVLATFTFEVAENAQTGDYSIDVLVRSCTNESLDDVEILATSGKISVSTFMYGDSTGDQKIDMKDVVLLRKYITNFDYDTNSSSVNVELGADANGDNKIDMKDVVILRKYITNYDFDTESSTVVLGPQ